MYSAECNICYTIESYSATGYLKRKKKKRDRKGSLRHIKMKIKMILFPKNLLSIGVDLLMGRRENKVLIEKI